MNPAVAILAGLFAVCALLPVITSAFFGYRTGERVAICLGAISGLLLLISCGFLVWLSHVSELSGEDKRIALSGILMTGVPALLTFMGNLASYIALGFLGSSHERK